MILNIWISGVTTLFLFVINLLPTADATVTANINSTATTLVSYLVQANYLFPMDTLAYVLGVMLTIELVALNWKVITKVAGLLSAGFLKL